MKIKVLLLAILFGLAVPCLGHSQQTESGVNLFPSGLSFSSGWGHYSVRDEFISEARYTGVLPFAEINWTRFEGERGSRVGLGLRTGGDVRNHTHSTTVTGAALDLERFFRIGEFSIVGKQTAIYLGPSAGVSVYSSDEDDANGDDDQAVSFASLVSVGGAAGVVMSLTPRLSASLSSRASVISVGFRVIDLFDADESPVEVLTAANAAYGTARLCFRYDLDPKFSMGLAYEAQMLRISAWDYLGVSSSNLFVTFTIRE